MTDSVDSTEMPTKKKGKKLLIIVPALLVLIGGGVGAGFYTGRLGGAASAAEPAGPKLIPKSEQKRGGTPSPGSAEAPAKATSSAPSGRGGDKYASNYYAMDKDFTANLQGSVHFLQVGIAVSTPYDDTVIENVKTNDIAVRSAILMALGDTTEEQVFTTEGKRQLQVRLTKAINDTLKQKEGFGGISNTYFTSFVVQ